MSVSPSLEIFAAFVLLWHAFEFFSQGIIHKRFSRRNLLITVPYLVALGIGLTEYELGNHFFPHSKAAWESFLFWPGIIITLAGQALRMAAILQGKLAFTHEIQTAKRPGHLLQNKGVYAFFRHPSYLGWYMWAVGTQILLANPVSFILYLLFGWIFLYQRIRVEENYLQEFFGENYAEYRAKVRSGIPFV
jgi:protein-S-isoprenylcysteine O-methyltransferase